MPLDINAGVFDLSDSDGVNESERYLSKLCRESFLSLWSFFNVHTAQDMREGKGSAKEFSDALVVFGNDVIIFSDKHVRFQREKSLDVSWPRWHREAVRRSVKQLNGAFSWLRRFPDRIFLDAKCIRPLPVPIPPAEAMRVHLISVARGAGEAYRQHKGRGSGSLQFNGGLSIEEAESRPFSLGRTGRNERFVHIFDEVSLDVVMRELNTISDFLDYLNAREAFLSDDNHPVITMGEECLVYTYLTNIENNKRALINTSNLKKPSYIELNCENEADSLLNHPIYKKWVAMAKDSLIWDELIEKYIRLGDPKAFFPNHDQKNSETERALRRIASESRMSRAFLSEQLLKSEEKARVATKSKFSRLVCFTEYDFAYGFIYIAKEDNESYEDYRRRRVAMLVYYAQCAKLKWEQGKEFILLAFDHPLTKEGSGTEDLCVYECDALSESEKTRVAKIRDVLGINFG